MPTYVVTGCTGGIGKELVKQLAERGEKVFGTARKTGVDLGIAGDVTIVEEIDVSSDSCIEVLQASVLKDVTIDVIIHNAGALGTSGATGMGDQGFAKVTTDIMRNTFELNTLGPLRVQQALHGRMKKPDGKVAIVSTGMGSISDNGSGGLYAYRSSKAAVNMVGKSMSCDFKKDNIPVVMINPGFAATDGFGGMGKENMAGMGAASVEDVTKGIITVLDTLTMDNFNGKLVTVPGSKNMSGEICAEPRVMEF